MRLRECNQPYFEFQAIYNGGYRPCCYFATEASFQKENIEQIWNSPYFQEIRAVIAGGETRGTGCEQCCFIKYQDKPTFTTPPPWLSGYRLENWLAAEKHHAQGDLIVSSLPVKYYLQFGLACNLRCTMCDHYERYKEGETSTLDTNLLARFKEYLAVAESVQIIGGEPLLIPSAVSFIKEFVNTPDLWATRLNLQTNAAFLDRFTDLLEPVERVSVTASLDSFGTHYESIRLRGKWDRVSENLKAFRRKGESLKRWGTDWEVHIACILQKAGIPGLPQLARWCVENQFSIHFGNVYGDHLVDENIFEYPLLLSDTPGWEDKFHEAIEILENGKQLVAANRLKTAINELTASLGCAEKAATPLPAPQKILLDTKGEPGIAKNGFWTPLTGIR